MAGPNIEVIKFGLYVFFPIAIMLHYGDPDWYSKHVLPYKPAFIRADIPQPVLPQNPTELQQEIKAMKERRAEARGERLRTEQAAVPAIEGRMV